MPSWRTWRLQICYDYATLTLSGICKVLAILEFATIAELDSVAVLFQFYFLAQMPVGIAVEALAPFILTSRQPESSRSVRLCIALHLGVLMDDYFMIVRVIAPRFPRQKLFFPCSMSSCRPRPLRQRAEGSALTTITQKLLT